jgi:hypothetical protein
MKAIVHGIIVSSFVIASILVVIFSVLVFLFTAATSANDPKEQYEPLIMFGFMLITIGSVAAGWFFFWRSQRKQDAVSGGG